MNSLTLDKAMELYEILGAHIPEVEDDDIDALKFIGKIIKSLRESGEHKKYTRSVMLMSDIEWKELKDLDYAIVLNLFIEGLSVNKIVSLKTFCEEIGFRHA